MATRKHPTLPIHIRKARDNAHGDPLRFLDLLPEETSVKERSEALLMAYAPTMDKDMADKLAKSWHHRHKGGEANHNA